MDQIKRLQGARSGIYATLAGLRVEIQQAKDNPNRGLNYDQLDALEHTLRAARNTLLDVVLELKAKR